MGKNVAVFVDVANIFYAAKAAGVDIDYVTLLKASSAGRDLVRAYAYTGLDPDNENQRNFHDFLRRNGYRVVSKDIRKYGDGKVKANLDIELVVDMMKTARNLDVAIVVSGDGDFAPAIRAVQEQGVRVEVVSFRGNTSSDLMDVADLFTDITQIARVEKGSSRSGRRVASDDDLSMTEVPDKQSEGTGERGRGRSRTRRATPVAATTRGRGRAAATSDDGEAPIVVLPGEKLSRAGAAPLAAGADDALAEGVELDAEETPTGDGGFDGTSEDGPRRRRRRGGRGRGRGRGRDEAGFAEGETDAPERVAASAADVDDEDEDEAPAPARRPASSFGSVWDSQIGIPASRASGAPIVDDEEDLEEPAVPEYLLAERRRDGGGRGPARGGRGRGGAYAAALDRERFGGGRGSTPSRFGEPPPRREGSFGRPDQERGPRRDDRNERGRGDRGGFRQAPRPAPRPSGDEPWSEVPPEIEAMLRAQLSSRSGPAPRREEPAVVREEPAGVLDPGAEPVPSEAPAPEAPASRRTSSRSSAGTGAAATRSRARRAPSSSEAEAGAAATPETAPSADAEAGSDGPATTTRRATTRRSRTTSAAATGEATTEAESAQSAPAKAPRRTASRAGSRTSTASTDTTAAEGEPMADADAAPKRRTTRRKAEPTA